MAKSRKPSRAKSPRGAASVARNVGGEHNGRQFQNGTATRKVASRGSSIQGELQSARGGNAGANQGGAPRGASRLEPSTLKKGTGRVAGKRHQTKGRGRTP